MKVGEYKLPSRAALIRWHNGSIYATTYDHSREVIKCSMDESSGDVVFDRTHGDQVARNCLHHLILGETTTCPLHLVVDRNKSFVGLWERSNTMADTLETVFEGELPYSIRTLRSANCRPVWDAVWASSKPRWCIPRSAGVQSNPATDLDIISPCGSNPETLGLTVDGLLCHFTFLGFDAWRFLRFLINLALRSPKVFEVTYDLNEPLPLEPVAQPKLMMHVDGNVLKRCLEDRLLEDILCPGKDDEERARTYAVLRELLQALHQGTLEKDASASVYVEQAYQDLEYFLRPVL